jgi:predicted ATP-binding protein involved in virulence
MRITSLNICNFKGFQERTLSFHPHFNLIIGENGAGKTSVLEALSIAAGSWFLGLRGYDSRNIRQEDVRLARLESGEQVHWEAQYPCVIEAHGVLSEPSTTRTWARALHSPGGRTTYGGARAIKEAAASADAAVRAGEEVTLPLISYYSTGRLWDVPREQARLSDNPEGRGKNGRSRLEGYRNSVDPRISVSELVRWVARESWRTFQQGGRPSEVFSVARRALIQNLDCSQDVYFDAALGEVIVIFEGGASQPFSNLSDGQRCMLALVGDLARKAATLNPHLGADVLARTPGVVMIDELDLHLHPRWQRRVIEDLRATFPALQFICTTHSPFLIQSLREGAELLMLTGQPADRLENKPLDEIARGIQGIDQPQVSARYAEMKGAAHRYLDLLERAN